MGFFRFPSLSPLSLCAIWFWLTHLLPNGGFNNHKRYALSWLLLFCWCWISIHAICEALESYCGICGCQFICPLKSFFDILKKYRIFLHSALLSQLWTNFDFVIWTNKEQNYNLWEAKLTFIWQFGTTNQYYQDGVFIDLLSFLCIMLQLCVTYLRYHEF